MSSRKDEVRHLRELAARLRSIANSDKTRMSPKLLQMAEEAERLAESLESSPRKKT